MECKYVGVLEIKFLLRWFFSNLTFFKSCSFFFIQAQFTAAQEFERLAEKGAILVGKLMFIFVKV